MKNGCKNGFLPGYHVRGSKQTCIKEETMKLNISGCRAYCARKGIRNYKELSDVLELSVEVIRLLEEGNEIG